MSLKVTQDKWPEVKAAIDYLADSRLMVGVPGTRAGRNQEDDGTKIPINNAALAYIHNYGSPEANIPARPFMEPGIASAQDWINKGFKAVGRAAMAGNKVKAENDLHKIGLGVVSAIRAKITTGPFQPLAPATLAARRRRGRTGEQPLLDTRQMSNAITYVIRKLTGK